MKIIKIASLFAIVFISKLVGQNTIPPIAVSPGIPVSFTYIDTSINTNVSFRTALNTYSIQSPDNTALRNYSDSIEKSCSTCGYSQHYGIGIRNTINLKSNAQYYNPSIAGGKLWIMRLTSQTALGFQFYFSKFMIPNKSFLHIYNADKSQMIGPFTNSKTPLDSTKAIHFGTVPVFSNDVFIEYYESDSSDFTGNIVMDNIIHIYNTSSLYSTIGASAPCQQDADCFIGWDDEINSVALILGYDASSNLMGTCTGSLINNTKQDGTPYFLTAGHCYNIGTTYDVGTWQFVFDYQKPCGSGNSNAPIYHKVLYGAQAVLAHDNICTDGTNIGLTSDYMLLQLTATPEAINLLNLCYAGWSFTDPIPAASCTDGTDPLITGVFIHHPKGDVKKVSRSPDVGKGFASPNFNCDPNTWSCEDYYNISTQNFGGGIEPGSSGAPLFDATNHRIIGTVVGDHISNQSTYNACVSSTYTSYFGRFSQHWAHSNGIFLQYLDPYGLSTSPSFEGVDTYCPSTPTPPNYGNTSSSGLDGGIRVNGKDGLPVFCPTVGVLSLTPLNATAFSLQSFDKEGGCPCPADFPASTASCHQEGHLITFNRHCYYETTSYQIYLQELDYNFQPIASYSKVYEVDNGWANYGVGYSVYSVGIHPSISFDIRDMVPSLITGRYYNIGIGSSVNGWRYSERIIYILPTSELIGPGQQFLNANIYATSDITLVWAYVYNNIDVAATNFVDIKVNTYLKAGHYFTQYIDCSTFRLANNQPSSPNNNTPVPIENNSLLNNNQNNYTTSSQITKKTNSNVLLYPNPANNNAVVEFIGGIISGKKATIQIYNSIGQIVKDDVILINQTQVNLNIGELNNGMYNIIVTQGNKTWKTKFIKE